MTKVKAKKDLKVNPITHKLSIDEKKALLDKCIDKVAGGFECMGDMYKELGIALPTVNKWCSEIPEYQEKLENVKSSRAIGYVLEAKRIMDELKPFYSTAGGSTTKDSIAMVTHAKARSDVLFKFAGALDPGMWGEMAKEVRDLSKELKKLQEIVKGSNADTFKPQLVIKK